MTDTESETLILLREVPQLLPCRPNGRRLHISAFNRWAQRGVQGVRREVFRIAGATYTTREALQRFTPLTSPGEVFSTSLLTVV